jgi:hypothetical protein
MMLQTREYDPILGGYVSGDVPNFLGDLRRVLSVLDRPFIRCFVGEIPHKTRGVRLPRRYEGMLRAFPRDNHVRPSP